MPAKSSIFLYTVWTVLSVLTLHRGIAFSDDFEVFWRSANALLAGEPVYSVETFGNMVFKYPPWILPPFVPFALLPLEAAKWVWGFFNAGLLLFIIQFLRNRAAISAGVLAPTLLAYGGLLLVHAMVGQITLVLLAIYLAGFEVFTKPEKRTVPRWALLVWGASAKIFTVFPLLALASARRDLKPLAVTAVILLALAFPVIVLSYGGDAAVFMEEWIHSVFSGTRTIEGKTIGFMTRELQGIPPFLMRVLDLSEEDRSHILSTTLVSFFGAAFAWKFASRKMPPLERWIGWIALTPLVQPLSWFHFFLLTLPLAAVTLQKAWTISRTRLFPLSVIGVVLITAVTQKTLGSVGFELEMLSVKTWGVLICLFIIASGDFSAGSAASRHR